jgi:hypothetical protein
VEAEAAVSAKAAAIDLAGGISFLLWVIKPASKNPTSSH